MPQREDLNGRLRDADVLAEVGSEHRRIGRAEVPATVGQALLNPRGATTMLGRLLTLDLDLEVLEYLCRGQEAPNHVPPLLVPWSWAPLTAHLDGI